MKMFFTNTNAIPKSAEIKITFPSGTINEDYGLTGPFNHSLQNNVLSLSPLLDLPAFSQISFELSSMNNPSYFGLFLFITSELDSYSIDSGSTSFSVSEPTPIYGSITLDNYKVNAQTSLKVDFIT
jgi:hypothetical protein